MKYVLAKVYNYIDGHYMYLLNFKENKLVPFELKEMTSSVLEDFIVPAEYKIPINFFEIEIDDNETLEELYNTFFNF